MTPKLLILDKDNTLVRPASGQRYVQGPTDQELISGVAEALTAYRDAGWATAIASNQAGIAARYKTLDDTIREMHFAMQLTGIETAMFAPSYEENGGEAYLLEIVGDELRAKLIETKLSKFRKPEPGMLDTLAFRHFQHNDYDESDALYAGDRDEDREAAARAGVNFLWAHDWLTSSPAALAIL